MKRPAWPSAQDYREAVADPDALGDEALRAAQLEQSPGGLPRAYSGSFTTTFHFIARPRDIGLRCYTRGNDDIARRYTAIAELLRYARNDALCTTKYVEAGIFAAGAWWPAVEMEWVAGRALNLEVEARLGDGDAMVALATQFRETVRSLEALGVAHGDLQHGNILVSGRSIRLIDYDAMFLPALADLPQTEWGHRNYQHPRRREAAFTNKIDRFSSLVIYTALTALSTEPGLWQRFNDGDNLLFRAHDFTANGESELMRALLANNAAGTLAQTVIAAARGPVEDVPSLETAILSAAGTMPASVRMPAPAPRKATVAAPIVPPPAPAGDFTVATAATRKRTIPLAAVVAVIAGLTIGIALALWPRGATHTVASKTTHVAIASAPRTPLPVATARPTAAPTASPTASPTIAPTHAPTIAPTAKPTAVPSRAPATATPKSAPAGALSGVWRLDEANVTVGSMVWSGVAAGNGSSTVLDVHKVSIAGRPASACERQTNLHVSFSGAAPQTVPFQETNCAGTTSSGELRIAGFSADGHTFSGSFWEDGRKVGDVTASRP